MHWPDPITTHAIEADRGPVLVTVEYRIDPKNRSAFLHALGQNSRERRRDGAYDWGIFEDPTDDSRFIETFLTDSWLEHLRLHRRVTKADKVSEQAVRHFQIGDGPKIDAPDQRAAIGRQDRAASSPRAKECWLGHCFNRSMSHRPAGPGGFAVR